MSEEDDRLVEWARSLPTWAMRDALNERGLIVVSPEILATRVPRTGECA